MKEPTLTVDEMMKLQDVPVVSINQQSIFTYLNRAFTKEYGWTEDDLLGKSVVMIMPKHMKSAHNIGFSRFLATETSELLGKPLPLEMMYKDGRVEVANHTIIGEKKGDQWVFCAIIDYPKTSGR